MCSPLQVSTAAAPLCSPLFLCFFLTPVFVSLVNSCVPLSSCKVPKFWNWHPLSCPHSPQRWKQSLVCHPPLGDRLTLFQNSGFSALFPLPDPSSRSAVPSSPRGFLFFPSAFYLLGAHLSLSPPLFQSCLTVMSRRSRYRATCTWKSSRMSTVWGLSRCAPAVPGRVPSTLVDLLLPLSVLQSLLQSPSLVLPLSFRPSPNSLLSFPNGPSTLSAEPFWRPSLRSSPRWRSHRING